MSDRDETARAEAERCTSTTPDHSCGVDWSRNSYRAGFEDGACWQRDTTSRPDVGDLREQVAFVLFSNHVNFDAHMAWSSMDPYARTIICKAYYRAADAVLATLPAPVVSGECDHAKAAREIARVTAHTGWSLEATMDALAAMTRQTDIPAADDEGGRE